MENNAMQEKMKSPTVSAVGMTDFTKTDSTVVSGFKIMQSIGSLVVLAIVLVVFVANGLPMLLAVGIFAFVLLIIVLQIMSFKKVASVNVMPAQKQMHAVAVDDNEKIVDAFAGIMRGGMTMRSVEILGVGQIANPENALVLTNMQVLFIVVPVAGADKTIEGTDIGMAQWLLAGNDIAAKLSGIVTNTSLAGISSMAQFALPLNGLRVKITTGFTHTISFSSGNEHYVYNVRDVKDLEKAKVMFGSYLVS